MEDGQSASHSRRRTFMIAQASNSDTGDDISGIIQEESGRFDSLFGNSTVIEPSMGNETTQNVFPGNFDGTTILLNDTGSGIEEGESAGTSTLAPEVDQLITNLGKGLIRPPLEHDDKIFAWLNARMETLYERNLKHIDELRTKAGFNRSQIKDNLKLENIDQILEIPDEDAAFKLLQAKMSQERKRLDFEELVIQQEMKMVETRMEIINTYTSLEKARVEKLVKSHQQKEAQNRMEAARLTEETAVIQGKIDIMKKTHQGLVKEVGVKKRIKELLLEKGEKNCICEGKVCNHLKFNIL